MKVSWPGSGVLSLSEEGPTDPEPSAKPEPGAKSETQSQSEPNDNPDKPDKPSAPAKKPLDRTYLIGLAVFTLTVVGYTLIGGFLAAVWTDLFQSVMMFFGVILLLILALPAGGLEQATRAAVSATSDNFAFGPGHSREGREFLTIGIALSFFVIWPFTGFSSPASVVRVMACRDTATIRRSMILLSLYNSMIYIPLIIICICAHRLPDLKAADEVIPRMAILTTAPLPLGSLLSRTDFGGAIRRRVIHREFLPGSHRVGLGARYLPEIYTTGRDGPRTRAAFALAHDRCRCDRADREYLSGRLPPSHRSIQQYRCGGDIFSSPFDDRFLAASDGERRDRWHDMWSRHGDDPVRIGLDRGRSDDRTSDEIPPVLLFRCGTDYLGDWRVTHCKRGSQPCHSTSIRGFGESDVRRA